MTFYRLAWPPVASKARLLSAAEWLTKHLEHEVRPLSKRLSERWIRSHCGVAGRTLEGASRCLFAGQPSTEAAGVIQKKLGKDGTLALALFASPAASPEDDPSTDGDRLSPGAAPETPPVRDRRAVSATSPGRRSRPFPRPAPIRSD